MLEAKDLLEKEEIQTLDSMAIERVGFKGVSLPPSSGLEDKILSEIRQEYLEARSPLQIKELKRIFRSDGESGKGRENWGDSKKDQKVEETSDLSGENSSDGKTLFGGRLRTDLDQAGNKTERDEKVYEEMGKCEGDMSPPSNPYGNVLKGLYNVTIGRANPVPNEMIIPPAEVEQRGKIKQSFHHPPIQYRIAFAKYIIKKLESSWNTPRGSNQENRMDFDVEETLEEWYSGLESLSNSGESLSEPFYRLYEIKQACQNSLEDSSTTHEGESQLVKIFEHETSFVADGTTGLVTWKASIEFVNWLTSLGNGEGLLEKILKNEVKWVLELGCGCGFLAVALTKCAPGRIEQYIATDGSLAALEKAKENVEGNFRDEVDQERKDKKKIRFERVDWIQDEQTQEAFTQIVDGMGCIHGANSGLLLGADVIFDPAIIPDLVGLIKEFVEAEAGAAILSCTIRNEDTMRNLKAELESNKLNVRIIGTWEDGEILEITW